MAKNHPSKLQTLLTLLLMVVGPLQVQNVFACSMMDEVMHGECCCVGHKSDQDCIDADCDSAADSRSEPCCERSTQVIIDHEAQQDVPVVKPVEIRSDVDPPPALVCAYIAFLKPPSCAAYATAWLASRERCSASDTYLVTQRLRI